MPVTLNSSFPIRTDVDLDFAPDTYVADWCALAASVQNVTGEWRRAQLLSERPSQGPASTWPDRLLRDTLPPAMRNAHITADPVRRGSGEYLPPYLPGELEIARIVLATSPAIVYSLRARSEAPSGTRAHDGRSSHGSGQQRRALRMVDEHGTTFALPRSHWPGTFTLHQLIRLIDSVRASNLPEQPEHLPFPEALALEATMLGVPYGQSPDLVHVSSVVYPELLSFYRARLRWWQRRQFKLVKPRGTQRALPTDKLTQWWRESRG